MLAARMELKMLKRIALFIIFFVFVLFSACTNQKLQNSSSSNYKSKSSKVDAVSSKITQSSNSQALETGSAASIPVLMYHSIIYEKNNSARVPKEIFEQQMKWLFDNGYKTLSLDKLCEHLQTKTGFPEKCVIITFDDGYIDNYTNAFPILKKYGFTATIFMISGNINTGGYLTEQQLKELSNNGISIQGHTVTHPYLDNLSYTKQYSELASSKAALEAITGKRVDFLTYPFGKYNNDTIKALKSLDYKMAFRMSGGFANLSDAQYELPRVYVGNSLEKFIASIK
jgi:peptidoglycan/xylan/chitin deacetylase (PgdA/CDA1 family)